MARTGHRIDQPVPRAREETSISPLAGWGPKWTGNIGKSGSQREGISMRRNIPAFFIALLVCLAAGVSSASARWPCGSAWQLEWLPCVRFETRTITCYRPEYRTEYREVQRTDYRRVPETRLQEIEETVTVPSWREEKQLNRSVT